MSTLPEEFPPLPGHFDNGVWPPNVLQAYAIHHDAYQYAFEALNAGDNECHRLRPHSEKLLNRMLPILAAMEVEVLNPQWFDESTTALAGLVLELEVSAAAIENVYAPRVLGRSKLIQGFSFPEICLN
jgi:hypothetical protein